MFHNCIKINRILCLPRHENLQRNMSFSGIFIEMSLTKFTLNIIGRNLCGNWFRWWSTGFNRSCHLPGLSNSSNKFIMTFSPITRSFLQRICFRFGSIFIKLQLNIRVFCLFEQTNKTQPALFLEWPHREHRNPQHAVSRHRTLFEIVFEQFSYKSVDVYAIEQRSSNEIEC